MTPTPRNYTRSQNDIVAVQFAGTQDELNDIGDWVRDQTDPDAVITVSPFPKMLYYASDDYFVAVEEGAYMFFDANNRLKKISADVFEALFEAVE